MKRLIALGSMALLCSTFAIGCAEKATTTSKTEATGPGGKTEVEHTETVKQSGENPPAVKE